MTIQENLIAPSHHIDMDDIVRDAYEDGRAGDPTLRQVADEVAVPLSDEDILLGEKMMEFLRNSQDPVMAEKMGLRGGVGLAANQLGIAKKIIACLVPNDVEIDDEGNEIPPTEAYKLQEIMYNAKIVRESVQEAALKDGEGCLSVDREVPGFVVRKARVTVSYVDKENVAKELKLRGFPAMCVQHEIDHTNGVMFYDRINAGEPWAIKDGMLVIE